MVRVFLDANVLFKKILMATFLDMAEKGIIVFLWSDEVIEEFSRNRKKKGSSPTSVDSTCADLKDHFASGKIEKADFTTTQTSLTLTDPKDRHVLSAAAVGGADYLATFNLSDFSQVEAKQLGVTVVHPDELLSFLSQSNLDNVLPSVKFTRTRMQNPTTTDVEFLEHLKKAEVPAFANKLANQIGQF